VAQPVKPPFGISGPGGSSTPTAESSRHRDNAPGSKCTSSPSSNNVSIKSNTESADVSPKEPVVTKRVSDAQKYIYEDDTFASSIDQLDEKLNLRQCSPFFAEFRINGSARHASGSSSQTDRSVAKPVSTNSNSLKGKRGIVSQEDAHHREETLRKLKIASTQAATSLLMRNLIFSSEQVNKADNLVAGRHREQYYRIKRRRHETNPRG